MHKNIFLIAATFIGIALCMAVFLAYPLFNNIVGISQELLNYGKKTAFIHRQNEYLGYFKELYNNNQEAMEQIDSIFVDANNPVDFIEFLEDIAVESSIEADIHLIPPKKKTDTEPSKILIRISAEGDHLSILSFCEDLETGPYLIEIQDISLSKAIFQNDLEEASSAILKAEILISVINR